MNSDITLVCCIKIYCLILFLKFEVHFGNIKILCLIFSNAASHSIVYYSVANINQIFVLQRLHEYNFKVF